MKILTALDSEVVVRLSPASEGVEAKSDRIRYVIWKAGEKTVATSKRSCCGWILSGSSLRGRRTYGNSSQR